MRVTLFDLGLLDLVGTRQRRGATEHFYIARPSPRHTDVNWRELGAVSKQRIISAALNQIHDYVTRSATIGGFDRTEAQFTRTALKLDEQGLAELATTTRSWLAEAAAIQQRAAGRLAAAPGPVLDAGLVVFRCSRRCRSTSHRLRESPATTRWSPGHSSATAGQLRRDDLPAVIERRARLRFWPWRHARLLSEAAAPNPVPASEHWCERGPDAHGPASSGQRAWLLLLRLRAFEPTFAKATKLPWDRGRARRAVTYVSQASCTSPSRPRFRRRAGLRRQRCGGPPCRRRTYPTASRDPVRAASTIRKSSRLSSAAETAPMPLTGPELADWPLTS